MGEPYTLQQTTDLAIAASGIDILREQATALVDEDSVALVFANRESVDVTLQIKSGKIEAMPLAGAAINAVLGDVPIIPDDLMVRTTVKQGERIQVLGTNVNAAPQELRVTVWIVSALDAVAMPQLISLS